MVITAHTYDVLFGALLEHNNIRIAVETVLAIDSNKGLILKTITNELELIDQKIHKNQLEWDKYGKRAKAGLGGLYLSPYFACFDFWWLPKIHTKT